MSKSLDLPSSLGSDIFRILHHILLVLCRRVIFAAPSLKISVYFSFIIFGPFLKDVRLIPDTSLSLRIHTMNTYISQLGWSWSIFLLTPFVYLTSLIYARGHYGLIIRHLLRLLVASVIWYIIKSIFIRFETLTGTCKPSDTRGVMRQACRSAARYPWQEGHTFLYLYALLVINEEVKLYDECWKKVEDASKLHPTRAESSLTINQNRIKMFSKPIGMFYFALAALTVLWEFMLLSTALHFYNVLHKLLAATLAVFFWLITYRVWFRMNHGSTLAPCSPGEGFIHFYN